MEKLVKFVVVIPFLAIAFLSNAQEIVPSFTVELAIVCDMDFSKSFYFDEDNITDYWINEVRDLELNFGTLRKTNIKFALTTVLVIKSPVDQPFIEKNRSDNETMSGSNIYLEFSTWAHSKQSELKSDVVILATGVNMSSQSTVIPNSTCETILFNFVSLFVIRSRPGQWHNPAVLAESMANLLGGEDDTENECKGGGLITDDPVDLNRRWYFSNCTDSSVYRYIMNEKPGCLARVENSVDLTRDTTRPKRVLSLSEQCKLFLNASTVEIMNDNNMCVSTLCIGKNSQTVAVTTIYPIQNTPCRNNHSFCFRGRCLPGGILIRNVETQMCVLSTNAFADNDYAEITDCPEIPEKYHELMIDDRQRLGLVLSMVYTNMEYKDKCLTLDLNEKKLKFQECPFMDTTNFGWDFVETGTGNGEFYLCHRSSKTCAVVDDSEQHIIFVNATLVLDNRLSRWGYYSDKSAFSDSTKYIRTGTGRFNYCQYYHNELRKPKCCSGRSSFQKCKPQEVTTTTTKPVTTTTTTEPPKTTTTTQLPTSPKSTTTEQTLAPTTSELTTLELSTSESTTTDLTTTDLTTTDLTTTDLTTSHKTITTTTEITTVEPPNVQTSNPTASTLKPTNTMEPQNIVSNEGITDYLWLIYLTLSLVVLLIIVIGTVFLVRFLRKSKRVTYKNDVISLDKFYKGDKSKINRNEGVASQADLLPFDKHWEFPMSRLKLGQKLGSGAFGLVVKAKACGILENEAETTVAVKMVNTCADVTHLKALMTELKIMSHLGGHLNIVNLLGACTKNIAKTRQLYVIIEFCKYGCLRGYLHKHRSHFVDDTNTSFYANNPKPEKKNLKAVRNIVEISSNSLQTGSSLESSMRPQIIPGNEYSEPPVEAKAEVTSTDNEFKAITTMDLMCWSFQIARGMEYLTSKRVLHGDLAARNCLLAENNVVKICDFGFAKTLNKDYGYNYKKNCEGVLLPFKWMAIESMKCGIFSSESDCWSYGVVLWEIFTLGETPYPGFNVDNDFIEYVSNGNRMSKPQHAPQRMYDLMLQCWSQDPQERPIFSTIVDTIGEMLEKDICEQYVRMNSDYQNISKLATKSDLLLKMGECERHKGCASEQNLPVFYEVGTGMLQ